MVLAVLVCQLAGFIGSIFTFSAISEWYAFLEKPFFSPPNFVFAPVWIALYTLMGVALYLVWEKGLEKQPVTAAIKIFSIQLMLNSTWSVIFFGLKNLAIAFIVILLLWIAIAVTIKKFYPLSKKTAWLLTPYLIWVSFATILNLSIWLLNT